VNILHLKLSMFCSLGILKTGNPDKAKPSVRRGRKATGSYVKMTEPLKDELLGCSVLI
jgi:hypothetical protein